MRRAASLVLLPTVLACVTSSLAPSAMPEAPLAFTFIEETEAKERAKAWTRDTRRTKEGTARLDDLNEWLGLKRRTQEKPAHQGRLAFLDLRDDDISLAGFALPGARPLDWSPDGSKLLFVSQRDGTAQIYEWAREADTVSAITRGPHAHPSASYGPDDRVAYLEVRSSGAGSISQLFVAGPGGGGARAVTRGPVDGRASWAPDGSRLVFEVAPHLPDARIAALDLASGKAGEVRLIARGRSPVFTADGQWVVYSARVRDGWRLRRMRPDGSGKIGFGSGPGDEHNPAISPDGRFVAYVSEEDHRYRLRLRALDGSGDRPLLSHGDGFTPTWN